MHQQRVAKAAAEAKTAAEAKAGEEVKAAGELLVSQLVSNALAHALGGSALGGSALAGSRAATEDEAAQCKGVDAAASRAAGADGCQPSAQRMQQ